MPVDILTTVFALLPEKDRCQAGLVCKAWNAVVNTPHLWRHHTFSFRGTNGKEAWQACKFVESALGAHVLHMVLEIGMPVVLNAKTISRSVDAFLSDRSTLSLRLKSFQCTGLEYFQSPVYRIARHRNRMVRALCTFLRRQKWLEEIDLACCQMGRPDGTRVLKAIAYKGRRSVKNPQSPLTYLELRHFFMHEANILDCPLFPVEMRRFDSLQHLCLNHSYVNDDVLDNLTNPSNTLRVLQLQVEVSQYVHLIPLSTAIPSKSVLTSAGWRSAAGRCPLLRVFITMKGRFRANDFTRVLVPGIPLAELRVTSVVASLFFGLEDFLPHLRVLMDLMNQHYSGYLSTVYLPLSLKHTHTMTLHIHSFIHLFILKFVSIYQPLPGLFCAITRLGKKHSL